DVDLAFRLQRAGHEIIYEPASRVLHHVSASHGVTDQRLLEQQSRNEERVFWRNMPARALPQHLAVVVAKAARRWREGTRGPFLRGRFSALGELATLVRHRRQLKRIGPDVPPSQWCVEDRYWG